MPFNIFIISIYVAIPAYAQSFIDVNLGPYCIFSVINASSLRSLCIEVLVHMWFDHIYKDLWEINSLT